MRRENGTGAIIKLSGKRRKPYAVRITTGWTDEGKQIYKYLSYHEKKTDARRALDAFNVNPYDIDTAKVIFEEVYRDWSEKAYQTLSPSSVQAYKTSFKHASRLHKARFKELKTLHLQDVVDAVESPSMAKMTKFLFQKMYRYAMELDIVEKDYSKFVTVREVMKNQETKEKHPFTKTEIQALWDNIDTVNFADMVLVLLYTGMRIGELLEMTKENVHIDERYMVGGNKTKSGKNRVIPIHNRIVPIIKKRLEESSSDYVFPNKRGTQLSYTAFRNNYWPSILKILEQKHTAHDTRHTFISELDRLGVNRVTLQRIVGHSNKEVTDIYTHKDRAELIAAVDLLD